MSNASMTVQEMLQAGMHFGHRPSKKHPKMDQYIFGVKQGINIIDLEVTKKKLEEVLPVVEEMAAAGKTILFLGSKRQAAAIIREQAEKAASPFVVERWLGGLFTNFQHVSHLMKKLTQLKSEKEQGLWAERYNKREQLELDRTIETLTTEIGGIEHMTKLPDALFVVDCKKEKTAIKEANRLRIPVIAIVDTNVNPEKVQYPIPANDDGVKSIRFVTEQIAAAIMRGKARMPAAAAPVAVAPTAAAK